MFNFQFLVAIVIYLCHALFCGKSGSRYPLKITASAVDDTLLRKIELSMNLSMFTIFQLSIMHSVCPPNFA